MLKVQIVLSLTHKIWLHQFFSQKTEKQPYIYIFWQFHSLLFLHFYSLFDFSLCFCSRAFTQVQYALLPLFRVRFNMFLQIVFIANQVSLRSFLQQLIACQFPPSYFVGIFLIIPLKFSPNPFRAQIVDLNW